MADVEQRIAAVEARVESAFALDARLKAIEGDVRKLKSSSLRDWLQTLGPYVAGLIVLLVGYWIKDSVTLAMEREKFDVSTASSMRDLILAFDKAEDSGTATANATALVLYGKHAIFPLVTRLERPGDVLPGAAARALYIVGAEHPTEACPRFVSIINDRSRRFRWQTHSTVIRVMGQSGCVEDVDSLLAYRAALAKVTPDERSLGEFAARYSEPEGFDASNVESLIGSIDAALAILTPQVEE
jgi:hypothetical protein